jgi:hypothetical protein
MINKINVFNKKFPDYPGKVILLLVKRWFSDPLEVSFCTKELGGLFNMVDPERHTFQVFCSVLLEPHCELLPGNLEFEDANSCGVRLIGYLNHDDHHSSVHSDDILANIPAAFGHLKNLLPKVDCLLGYSHVTDEAVVELKKLYPEAKTALMIHKLVMSDHKLQEFSDLVRRNFDIVFACGKDLVNKCIEESIVEQKSSRFEVEEYTPSCPINMIILAVKRYKIIKDKEQHEIPQCVTIYAHGDHGDPNQDNNLGAVIKSCNIKDKVVIIANSSRCEQKLACLRSGDKVEVLHPTDKDDFAIYRDLLKKRKYMMVLKTDSSSCMDFPIELVLAVGTGTPIVTYMEQEEINSLIKRLVMDCETPVVYNPRSGNLPQGINKDTYNQLLSYLLDFKSPAAQSNFLEHILGWYS